MIDLIALFLGLIHFSAPLIYYFYLKRHLTDPWNLSVDLTYKPNLSLLVPTYLEAQLIGDKLDDLMRQDYPRDLMEVVVVDSASGDGTAEEVREWMKVPSGCRVKLVEEGMRRGKAHALNYGLKWVDEAAEVVVITDVDCLWERRALAEVVKYFSDATVGAVTCVKIPKTEGSATVGIEDTYREYYTKVRVAESKIHSTVVFHGELAAFRREALEKVGGFPLDVGADDSHTASLIAMQGFRSICVPEARVTELVPQSWKAYLQWRTRRAQHLIQHFTAILRMARTPEKLARVLAIEAFLHLFNPWLLLTAFVATLSSLMIEQLTQVNTVVIAVFALILLFPTLRRPFITWITEQVTLAYAQARNLVVGKEIIWRKVSK